MSLKYYAGSSVEDNSVVMIKDIIDYAVNHESENILVIVPEQFTLQTQKRIVDMHPNRGMLNIDVLSFMRLAFRVFDELGRPSELVLEDTGKNMILRKVIGENKDQFSVFVNNFRKQGFISEIKSLISELCQYSVEPETLGKIANEIDNINLRNKLIEVSNIYSLFKDYLKEKYITAEEILDILYGIIDNSKIIEDSVICFDGYTGFTPIQYKLLGRIMQRAKKVVVSVTIDADEIKRQDDAKYRLFGMSKGMLLKLNGIAANNNVKVEGYVDVDVLKDNIVTIKKSDTIRHLEKYLFRYPYRKYCGETNDIKIFTASDMASEAEHVLRQIKKLVEKDNYRYREIAIITGDICLYSRVFEDIFKKNNIPYFIDNKKGILDNPFIEMINAVFEIVQTNYSYESVFRYLRSGMTSLNNSEIDILENYVIALGKKGEKAWKSEWNRTYYTNATIDLELINELRIRVLTELSSVITNFNKAKTVKDYCIVLYNFLDFIGAEEKIDEYVKLFEDNNEMALAKEYSQVYKTVMDLLDKMVTLLCNEEITMMEFAEIFVSGVEEIKIGVIPMTVDQLIIGDIERTRLNNIKALFFVGVNDGIVPGDNNKGGIISDLDREMLAKMSTELAEKYPDIKEFELSPTKRQKAFIQQFYLYMLLTKPQEKLFISYVAINNEGKPSKESYIVNVVKKLFEKIENVNEKDELEKGFISISEEFIKNYLIDGLREKNMDIMTAQWKEIFRWYQNDTKLKKTLDKYIEAVYYSNEDTNISKAVADAIFGNKDKSVTELELYAGCAYAHFLQYGIKLKERAEYEIRIPDMGTIFHEVLQQFSRSLNRSDYNWSNIPDNIRDEMIDICVDNATEEFGNFILHSTKRNEYMINRIKRVARKTAWALCRHLKSGEFIPAGFEVKFFSENDKATTFTLEDGRKIGLRGAIDRIDLCADEENEYIKVIDYKSGHKNFEPELFAEGIQMQLVVYMNVALEKRKKMKKNLNIEPAGAFYYTIDDPIVDKDEKLQKSALMLKIQNSTDLEALKVAAAEAALDKLVMKGIVNSDSKIISKLDSDMINEEGKLSSSYSSNVVKAATNKSGDLKNTSNAISTEDFDLLREHVEKKVIEYSSDMYNGKINKLPYKSDNSSACDYCEYNGICKFDIRIDGCQYKKIEKKTLDDVLSELKPKEG